MDPISVTLAVITFATALKDAIEMANAIHDAFSKSPQNYRNAQRLSKSMLGTLEELEDIYEDKKIVIDGKKHLKRAIVNLSEEMKFVHDRCIQLLPPVSERKRDRFKVAIYSLWSRKKVEQMITELHEHVNGCFSKFSVFSTIRTETQVVEIHETLALSHSKTSEIHEAIINGRSPRLGDGHTSSGFRFGDVSHAHLGAFTGSSSLLMSRILDTIPTHVLSTAYLRRELGKIFLPHASIKSWVRYQHSDLGAPLSTWNLPRSPILPIILQKDTISLTFMAQNILQENPTETWAENLDCTLKDLSESLGSLDLNRDALFITNILVEFWREVTKLRPHRTSLYALAEALTDLAFYSLQLEDRSRAYLATSEANQCIQLLLGDVGLDVWFRRECMHLLGRNKLFESQCETNGSNSVQLAIDAVKIFEQVVDISVTNSKTTNISLAIHSTGFDTERDADIDDLHFTYADCLYETAVTQLAQDQDMESNGSARKAMDMLNFLNAKYPDSSRIRLRLMDVLDHLSEDRMRSLNDDTENLLYTEKNSALYRTFVKNDPQNYIVGLTLALWTQQDVLVDLGKEAQAEELSREMISMRELAALPPHADIQIPSETEAEYYYEVGSWHFDADRLSDAILAAQNAISLYSALEFMEPGRSREKHVNALYLLCDSLQSAGQYDVALKEGFKALDIIDKEDLHTPENELVQTYEELLLVLVGIVEEMLHDPGSRMLPQVKTMKYHIQKLARLIDIDSDLVDFASKFNQDKCF